jgi:dCMP deaminase
MAESASWDEFFFKQVRTYAEKSKDQSTQVGSIIVDEENGIRAGGYNGLPRGLNDDVPERHERPEKYFWFEHAERDAIYNAARVGVPLKDCILYVSLMPCTDCARAIIQSGIKEVVTDGHAYAERVNDEKWAESFKRTKKMLAEAGIALRLVYMDENGKVESRG